MSNAHPVTPQTTRSSLSMFPRSREWSANWIWHAHAPLRNAWVLFRAEFEIDDPAGAVLFATADTRYRIWINGQLLGDGPVQSQPYHQFYDERPIEGHVRRGKNCVAVLVHHQGVQEQARGGLLVEIIDKDNTPRCRTESTWRAMLGPWNANSNAYNPNKIGPFQEHVDLRGIPAGWTEVDFDDTAWDRVVVIGHRGAQRPPLVAPWFRLLPRDIPFLKESRAYATRIDQVEECLDLALRARPSDITPSLSQAGRPVEWTTVRHEANLLRESGETTLACSDRHRDGITDGRYDPCITLDFGQVLTAYAEIEVDAPAGAMIEIGYAERLIDGRVNLSLECPFADRVTFAAGPNVYRPLVWRSFRYLRLRLKHCEQPLKVRAVRAIEVEYPYEARGLFRGDARLEKVFDICRTTLKLCSIESIMDTPYREQAQWLGDVAAVTVPAIYACFGDTTLPGKFIRQAAMNTRPTGVLANISNVSSSDWSHDIPDYSLWWVICFWKHHLYAGDERYLHDCYPEMQRIMRAHLERIGPDGLLRQMFGWVFIDWAHVDVRGGSAAYNAIFAGACDAAAAVARVKNDRWAEATYSAAAAGVRKAFAGTFIDRETGAIIDAVDQGKPSDRRSEQSNAAAIAFGCVDDTAADRIIDVVFENRTVKTIEAQPFFMVVVLEALRKRGRIDLALKLIEDRWGKRLVDRGRTSCTEEWYENGSWRNGDWQGFQRTHSHAWSACAAEFLITGLGGIDVLEQGCSKMRVSPAKTPFPYEITYPTPRGDVRVKWDGRSFAIEVPESVQIVS